MPTLPAPASVPLWLRATYGAQLIAVQAVPVLLAVAALYWALAPELPWWRFVTAALAAWYLVRSAFVDALSTRRS